MAIYESGINGPFKGKVGSVVSYQWRGIWVMRSVPKASTKKRSLKQLANQQKMSLVLKLLQRMIAFVRKGYHLEGEKRRMSAFNAAMSYSKVHAVKGEYPDFEIDYGKFRFADGDLDGAENLQVVRFEDRIEFTWDPKVDGNGEYDDQVMVLLISKEGDLELGELSGVQRKDGKQSIYLESQTLKDHTFESYFAFISDDRSRVSDSVYMGTV
jgi:hypothetical protein